MNDHDEGLFVSDEDPIVESSLNWHAAKRPLILLKVPRSVSQQWEKVSHGGSLGNIGIKRKTEDPSSEIVSITLQAASGTTCESQLVDNISGNVPTTSGTSRNARSVPMLLFREKNSGQFEIGGTFEHRARMLPTLSRSQYAKKLHNTIEANQVKRIVQIQEDNVFHGSQSSVMQNQSMAVSGNIDRKEGKKRKTRMTEGDLKNELFGLFSQRDLYTFKELAEATDQPEGFLRTILQEVAESVDPSSATYALKSHFKVSSKETAAVKKESGREDIVKTEPQGTRVKEEKGKEKEPAAPAHAPVRAKRKR